MERGGQEFNDKRGETVLARAVVQGNIEMVRLLLEKGANPNTEMIRFDPRGDRIAGGGFGDNVRYDTTGDPIIIPFLGIGAGPMANPDYIYYGGGVVIRPKDYLPPLKTTTAIEIARKNGHAEIIKLLKAAGAKE